MPSPFVLSTSTTEFSRALPRACPLVGKCCGQASLDSLAADKAAAQSRAVDLKAQLAKTAGDRRRRAEKSRRANAVAADRLAAAESRARTAEARVEAAARHLTISERRLREAERRAGEAEGRSAEERKAAAEAAAAKGAKNEQAGQQETVDRLKGEASVCVGRRVLGSSVAQRCGATLARAPNSARTENIEQSRAPPNSRASLQPSELNGNRAAAQAGHVNGGLDSGKTMAAVATAGVVSREQQTSRHDQQENFPVSAIEGKAAAYSSAQGGRFPGDKARANGVGLFGEIVAGGLARKRDAYARYEVREATPSSTAGGEIPVEAGRQGGGASAEGMPRRRRAQEPRDEERHPGEGSPRTAAAEIGSLGRDLAEARAAAVAATECRRAAEARVGELEEVIAESEREHALFRARGESRLEFLRLAFEQEQEEGATQVRLPPLWVALGLWSRACHENRGVGRRE